MKATHITLFQIAAGSLLSVAVLIGPTQSAPYGGYAVSTDQGVYFIDGDGTTFLGSVGSVVTNLTGLVNGNVVGYLGSDNWQVLSPANPVSPGVVDTRNLDNSGTYNDVAATGGGGYVAVASLKMNFVAADGSTFLGSANDPYQFVTTLTNGNVVGYRSADQWTTFTSNGTLVFDRNLDNSGVYNAAAATGGGGYVAVSNTLMHFIASDGNTVLGTQADSYDFVTTLSDGSIIAHDIGTDNWVRFTASGVFQDSRTLDGLGTFTGAAATGGGGYAVATVSNLIFVGSDNTTVHAVVNESFDFLTSLYNGNIVAHDTGTDNWLLYSPLGNLLATRNLDGIGIFTGAAPIGALIPEPASLSLALMGCCLGMVFGRRKRHTVGVDGVK